MNAFVVGNLAVYHGKGVGLITGLQTEDPRGNSCTICALELKKSTAQVRVDHPGQSTIRAVMTPKELDEVYTILKTQDVKPNKTTWNRRYRGYIQNINSGIPELIASVFRDLELLGITKSLSFGESKIYTEAKELIIEEGAYTLLEPHMNEFLLPFNDLKNWAHLQNLKQMLNKGLPVKNAEFSDKGLKEISNLRLTIDADLLDGEHKFAHFFNALVAEVTKLEDEANKTIMRLARKEINKAHEPNKSSSDGGNDLKVLLKWKKIRLVGILEPQELYSHKSYEQLTNLFVDKGSAGLEDFDLESIVEPMVRFANHHLITLIHELITDLDLKRERRRRTRSRAKPAKPVTRRGRGKAEPEPEAPLVLNAALRKIEGVIKEFKPKSTKGLTFAELQQEIYDCFQTLDTRVRMESLEVTRTYLAENLDKHREKVAKELEEIFREAKERGEREKEEKAKNKRKNKAKKSAKKT